MHASVQFLIVSCTVDFSNVSEMHFSILISEIEKGDHKTGRSNHYLINALKTDPSLTKELRVVLEQALEEKLESLGIKAVRLFWVI